MYLRLLLSLNSIQAFRYDLKKYIEMTSEIVIVI